MQDPLNSQLNFFQICLFQHICSAVKANYVLSLLNALEILVQIPQCDLACTHLFSTLPYLSWRAFT